MSLVLGKSDIKEITGKVTVYKPTGSGTSKKAGVLKVTVEVLPRTQLSDLLALGEGDLAVAKRLVKNIEAGDDVTQAAPYTPALMDEIFEYDWQFAPIYDFALAANNERLARVLKAKN